MKKKTKHIQAKPQIQVVQKKEIKWTNMGRFKLFLLFVFIFCFFIFFINYLLNSRKDEISLIKSNYKICRGIITDIKLYKGQIVRVKFKVNNVMFEGGDGLDNRKNKKVGDSITVMYSVQDPNLFITELNNSYP